MEKWWYLKIRFKEKHDGRKIWYMNDNYLCDCINLPFKDKARCESYIPIIKAKYGDRIESITLHWTR
jgi:hypothetical protein